MSNPEQAAVSSNADACVELFRVTLLSLEGIEVSEETLRPNHGSGSNREKLAAVSNRWRITAWAGFRSSFPTGCLSVPTSHYSTIFQTEGNLLAVESDQIEFDSSASSLGESGPVGKVHWQDYMQYDERQLSNDGGLEHLTTKPQHHLQVTLPPPPTRSEPTLACDDLMLPDIIEIHVCIVCKLIDPQFEESADEDLTFTSFRKKGRDTTSCTKEEHFSHGIAHMKIPSREQSTVNNLDLSGFSRPGGKVVMLPIRTKLPTKDNNETGKILARFVNNAILSMRVEKSTVPLEQFNTCKEAQRHYIKSDWNGESCAPASLNSFESKGKGNHIVRAGQILNDIRQTLSSQMSNLRKSDEEQLASHDLEQSKSIPSPKKSFSHLLKLTCGELGDVLQGDEMGMYDQSNTMDSSLATADVMGT